MDYTAKDAIKPRDGFATFEGRRYILVDARYLPDPKEEDLNKKLTGKFLRQ